MVPGFVVVSPAIGTMLAVILAKCFSKSVFPAIEVAAVAAVEVSTFGVILM